MSGEWWESQTTTHHSAFAAAELDDVYAALAGELALLGGVVGREKQLEGAAEGWFESGGEGDADPFL
ncbi:MAG TPA: hypothetical protein VMP01_23485, partial [Pirellulaceae bacterium]|nr:hypothetical protein [Pirellulaceae bacterium]